MTGHQTVDHAVFGPVPSRRLGMSLGVDLVWPKTCTLDCIYCELGPTTDLTTERRVYRDEDQVLAEVAQRLQELENPPDYITLAGSGEPTLHLGLGRVIKSIKELSPAKVAVLTNGTLAGLAEVRADLARADLVVPSLDAVTPAVFRRVNRPARGLDPAAMIEGLIQLNREHPVRLWLEVLLVAGVNDSEEEVGLIVEAAERIGPELVQLNTVVRPPSVKNAEAVPYHRLAEIAERFTMNCEVIAPPAARAGRDRGQLSAEVVEMTRRRPCTVEDVANMAGVELERAEALICELEEAGRLKAEHFGERVFYRGV